MILPHADKAIVEPRKLADYLLNPAHPDNGGKARFFATLGFSADDTQSCIAAFREMVRAAPVAHTARTAHGTKYVVDGAIRSPSGKIASIRSVWIIDRGAEAPRLVTAYPAG